MTAAWHLSLLLTSLSAFAASFPEAALAATLASGEKPNIVLILVDDLGYGALGCYGQKLVATPNIDRMAAEGLRFTDAYSGGPVCASSRCVLMTGVHGGHARVRGNGDAAMPGLSLLASDVSLPRVMKDAGYATGLIGKWGLGDVGKAQAGLPTRQGFDYFFGYLRHGHAHNYYPAFLWRNESKVMLRNGPTRSLAADRGTSSKKIEYSHDLFAEEAFKFVREHAEQPFFLNLAFTIPHCNNEAGANGMETPGYGSYADRDWPEPLKGYAAMMERMDGDVGRLLALIKQLGIDEKTLVIFASDNGAPRDEGGFDAKFFNANGPLRGYKGHVTEAGIRIPLIARWPGHVPAGKTTATPVYFADVMPTFASLAGGNAPQQTDGKDFSPTLAGKNQPEMADRFFYWEFDKLDLQQQGSRWNNWKAIRDPKSGSIELFDLAADIGETKNLAAERPDIVAKFVEFFRTARTDSPYWPATAKSTGPTKRKATANPAS
ncbi:arylsulfatase [Lacipirellula sp.]|uniref:arylsulfatase n=1 Tax=Lacipirellula sp. TaxID=2691419 RepID=UPI003D09C160